jgi:hypothetical protein
MRSPWGITRSPNPASLRAPSERWGAAIRRRPRRLGWRIEFTPAGGGEPVLCYYPGVLHRGRLVLAEGRRYKLRPPLVRAEWRLLGGPCGELVRGRYSPKHIRMDLRLGANAASEARPLLVLLAACDAISSAAPSTGEEGGGEGRGPVW